MKRTFLVFLCIPLLGTGRYLREDGARSILYATPLMLEAAEACARPEQASEGNVSNWPDEPPIHREDNTSTLLGVPTPTPYIAAYTDKRSYLPGETIRFHVSTTADTYSIEIRKEQWQRKVVAKATNLPGKYYPMPPYEQQPWATGANWPVSYSWVIPQEWENGNYLALLRTTSGEYAYTYHPFIVRTRVLGSRSKIAFVTNYNTRQTYNRWGGRSMYYNEVPWDLHYAVAVSFLRPFAASYGRGDAYWGQWEVSSQLIADGFDPEFITEWDISSNPAILRAYDVLVFAGHHEYISRNMYDVLQAYHHRGGHLAFFSANDIYWQVRFEDGGNTIVCYKSYAWKEDPMMGVDDSLVTTRWNQSPARPAEALQGICYVPYSYLFEREDFIVQDCSHFIFEGTPLQNGDALGWKMASCETDYIGSKSPAIMDVILTARRERVIAGYENRVPVDHIDAAAVYYQDSPKYGFPTGRGGQVFSAGTNEGWGDCLGDWSAGYETVRIVTRNIIQHMVDAPPPPVSLQDLAVLASHWLDKCSSPNWCEYADVDMTGTVNLADFAHLAASWHSVTE
jgi:hypothetical protein